MKKQLVIVCIAALLITVVGLSGCNEEKQSPNLIVGTWQSIVDENDTITFSSDGTFVRGEFISGTYETGNGRLTMYVVDNTPGTHPDNAEFISVFDYSFSDNDQTLTLLQPFTGQGWFFTRQ